jgi:hypothetical protein
VASSIQFLSKNLYIQSDSKLLLGFPWPIIFKMEIQNKTVYDI